VTIDLFRGSLSADVARKRHIGMSFILWVLMLQNLSEYAPDLALVLIPIMVLVGLLNLIYLASPFPEWASGRRVPYFLGCAAVASVQAYFTSLPDATTTQQWAALALAALALIFMNLLVKDMHDTGQ